MSNKPSAKPITLFLLLFLGIGNILLLTGTVKGVEIFVSPAGNDNWSGRLAQTNSEKTDGPLATLEAALEVTRKIGADQPRRMVLKAGEYYLEKPLVLDRRDNNLEIVAVEGERVVLYGGKKIKGWRKEGKRFFFAALPGVKEGSWDFRVLIVNGRYCQRTRLPEKGKFEHRSEFKVPWMSTTGGGWKRKPTQAELTTLKFKPEDLPDFLEARNAEVRVYHMWDESLVGLSRIDREKQVLHFSTPSSHPAGAFGVKNYVIYNVREGMTQPGQWYLDRHEGKVVYWPLEGEDMTKAVVLAPTVESVIHIRDERNKPVENITLKGFKVAVTTTPLRAGGFGAARFAGAVQVDNAQNCRLNDLEIFNVGGQGIKVNGGRTEISYCQVHHTGACGIKAPSCVVTDNHIHDIGLTYPSSIALLGGGSNGVFSHNEIHDAPYTGINCGGANQKIESNHIYRVMQKLHDGGGIYCFAGKNTVLRGNFIHDVIDTGGYGSSAYYLDERSEQCIVEKNLSVNVARPAHNHMAHHNTIRNNVFIHDGDMRLTFPKCSDFTFRNNVLYATGKITINGTNVLTDFKQNILYSNKGEVIGQTINNYSTTSSEPLKPDEKNSFADPGLLKYKTGLVKFSSNSPALKSGITEIDVTHAGPRTNK
jgi:parallel beta helix pectate lyase-like protein